MNATPVDDNTQHKRKVLEDRYRSGELSRAELQAELDALSNQDSDIRGHRPRKVSTCAPPHGHNPAAPYPRDIPGEQWSVGYENGG